MRRLIQTTALAALAAMLLASAAFAQGPGGPGGFQPSPQMQAQFQKWRAWQQNHKNVSSLQRTLRGLMDLEQDPSTKLNKAQAGKVLTVISKWKNKPTITDAQAHTINQQLTASLTTAQLQKLAAGMTGGRGRGGFGGGGGGRPGGFGGGGGGRRGGFGGGGGGRPGGNFQMPAPHDYNPLNANTLPFPPMRQRAADRMNAFISALKATR
ncbi:MAG TPA: hypothetical protein VFW40_02835 [Capsulimonadaceae bacterium]|nr:hypothetical protein [Capsulimonadaceae bacterium]